MTASQLTFLAAAAGVAATQLVASTVAWAVLNDRNAMDRFLARYATEAFLLAITGNTFSLFLSLSDLYFASSRGAELVLISVEIGTAATALNVGLLVMSRQQRFLRRARAEGTNETLRNINFALVVIAVVVVIDLILAGILQ